MTFQNISFNDIPKVLEHLVEQLDQMGEKLDRLHCPQKDNEQDVYMTAQEVCDFLPNHPATGTIYKWTSAKLIPYHKRGKNILFLKSEIIEWMKGSTVQTIEQARADARAEFKNRSTNRLNK